MIEVSTFSTQEIAGCKSRTIGPPQTDGLRWINTKNIQFCYTKQKMAQSIHQNI